MRENGIAVKRNKKFKATTDSNHKFNIAPNLLARNFHADRPNQKWASDISYVWTQEGWLYLAVILDLHSRRVIGWDVSITVIGAANIVHMITKKSCAKMASNHP